MKFDEIVASTAEAAFATGGDGRVLAWNEAAERLLGHSASRVVGRRCHEVVGGIDVFGNRFCDEVCPLRKIVARHEAVRHFRLELRRVTSERIVAEVSAFAFPGEGGALTVVHLLRPVDERERRGPADGRPPVHRHRLTAREMEVLRLLADGRATGEIAEALCVSTTTVRNHIQHVLHKLGTHSRVETVATARHRRLV